MTKNSSISLTRSLGKPTGENKKMNDNIISAEAHSDDHKVEVSFDATSWFSSAEDEQISDLIKIGYAGDFASDSVAEFFGDNQTKRLFDYLSFSPTMGDGDNVGFECSIDEVQANEWVRKNRPHLLPNEYRFTVSGGVDIKGHFKIIHDQLGEIVGFKMADGRTIKLVVGLEVESADGEKYEYICGDDEKTKALGFTDLMYDNAGFALEI